MAGVSTGAKVGLVQIGELTEQRQHLLERLAVASQHYALVVQPASRAADGQNRLIEVPRERLGIEPLGRRPD